MVTGVPCNVGGGGSGVGLGLDEPEQATSVMRNKRCLWVSAVRAFETDMFPALLHPGQTMFSGSARMPGSRICFGGLDDDRLPVLGGCNQSRMKTVAPLPERTRWAGA
jgi:hypothetical protein